MFSLAGQSYKFGEKIGSYMFEDDPGLSPQSGSSQDSSKVEQRKTAYRCRKCRRVIAVEDNVVSHVPGEGESCFDWNRKRSAHPYSNKEQDCSSLFVEPLKWMTPGRLMLLPSSWSMILYGPRNTHLCCAKKKIIQPLRIWLVPIESIYFHDLMLKSSFY